MLISVQAENSDNKLSQQDWHAFVMSLDALLRDYETTRHFFGGSVTWASSSGPSTLRSGTTTPVESTRP